MGVSPPRRAIVVDLDGTLFDTRARWEACKKDSGNDRAAFWDCYLSDKYMDMDALIPEVALLVREFGSTHAVVVVSGRDAGKQLEATVRQLEAAKLPYHYIILKKDEDRFMKNHEFKKRELARLANEEGLRYVLVIDDDERMREVAEEFDAVFMSPDDVKALVMGRRYALVPIV